MNASEEELCTTSLHFIPMVHSFPLLKMIGPSTVQQTSHPPNDSKTFHSWVPRLPMESYCYGIWISLSHGCNRVGHQIMGGNSRSHPIIQLGPIKAISISTICLKTDNHFPLNAIADLDFQTPLRQKPSWFTCPNCTIIGIQIVIYLCTLHSH